MGAPGSEEERRAGPLPMAASGMALLGWLIGTPLLMVLWGGWPLSGLPGWTTFRDLPLPDAVDAVVIGAVSVALWGVWGQFAYSVVSEIVTLVRRRERVVRSDRTDDVLRRFAHYMVESVSREPSPLARFTRPPAVDRTADAVTVRPVEPARLASARAAATTDVELASRRAELETVAAGLVADARVDVESWPDPTAPWQSRRRTALEPGESGESGDRPPTPTPTSRRRPRKGSRHAGAEVPVAATALHSEPKSTGRVVPPGLPPVARPASAAAGTPAAAGSRPGRPAATAAEPPLQQQAPVPLGTGGVQRLDDILGEVEVLVRVLGEVEAVRPGPTSASAGEHLLPARQKALEALVYLALSDVGVSRKELERVLFPTGPTSERVLYNTIKSVLKVVGEQHPAATTGRHYVLSERVVTDYGIFCDLTAGGERAEQAEDPELSAKLLSDALDLVRGEPFSGISRGYTWAAAYRATMAAQVVDVAERLAALHMASGEWAAAEEAARRGLLASPGDERLEDLLTHVAGRR